MPAEAGIKKCLKTLDSRLRGNDANGRFQTFYEGINFRTGGSVDHKQESGTDISVKGDLQTCM